jgi:hypothetical protein
VREGLRDEKSSIRSSVDTPHTAMLRFKVEAEGSVGKNAAIFGRLGHHLRGMGKTWEHDSDEGDARPT